MVNFVIKYILNKDIIRIVKCLIKMIANSFGMVHYNIKDRIEYKKKIRVGEVF